VRLSVWQRFLSWFNQDSGTLSLDVCVAGLASETYVKELAVQACINLIANTVARSEFRTYEKGEETRKDNYYLFNVEPNPNRNASKFWREVIARLVYDNECLVIQEGGYLYVAESFERQKFAFKEHVYTDVVVDEYKLKGPFF